MIKLIKSIKLSKKGQMFLIAAIVIVASVVIIKSSMSYPSATSQEAAAKGRFENDIFDNVANEFNETLSLSYGTPTNITKNIFDFANFTELKMAGQSMTLKFLFVGAIANKTTDSLNISSINMLDSIIDASFILDGQTDSRTNIANYERWNTNFTITPGSTYTLNLTYNLENGGNVTESITVKTKKNKDVYVGFFYILLEGPDATHVGRYQKTVNLK